MGEIPQQRRLVTPIPGPRSLELFARRQAAVPPGVSTTLPVFIDRACGGVLVDVDGNQLIDLGSGIAVVTVGHAAPAVVDAVREQVDRFTHTCFMVTPYEGYVAVCEHLNRLTPGDHAKRSMLVNSGAEAVENAVKIARYATGRQAVVVFDQGYHGRTLLTMTMTAKAMPYKHGFGPFAPDVYRAEYSYPYRGTGDLAETIRYLETTIGASSIACVVVEPIAGEGGFVVPASGWLRGLSEWCTANGIVFIADEVQTGFARTGDMFASEHDGVVPDIVTTAKAMGGGLPLAGVTGRAELMDAVHVGGLGGTFGGNPVACAAALGAIAVIESHDLVTHAQHIENVMKPRLLAAQQRHVAIGDVRGRGAMLAVEIVDAADAPDPAATSAVAKACHAEGVLVLTAGTAGNVLRFLPPLVIEDDLLADALDVLDKAFDTVLP
jgi:4-aminobutyrate aminotransferase/(S)-3-amino-2-methylpropionate transaminase